MTHCCEVIDLVGLSFLDDPDQVGTIGHIAVVQLEANVGRVRVLVKVIDAIGVYKRGSSFNTVNDISFF